MLTEIVEAVRTRKPDGLLDAHGIPGCIVLSLEERDHLLAALPQWRPMASMPKDGTEVLVWSSGTGRWPRIAKWCEFDDKSTGLAIPGGIYNRLAWIGLDDPQLGVPSHWMPLPPIPPAPTPEPGEKS